MEAAQAKLADTNRLMTEAGLRECMRSPSGRKFLWWLLEIGKVGLQPFTSNALNTAFQCGELNVGNQILAKILEVDPAVYVQMQQENLNAYNALVDPAAGMEHGGGFGTSPGRYDHPDAD